MERQDRSTPREATEAMIPSGALFARTSWALTRRADRRNHDLRGAGRGRGPRALRNRLAGRLRGEQAGR